jgi:hypothetical protein
MPRKISDERKRYWRDLVERQPSSGLNIARFCADADISQNAFYVWKKRLLTTTQQGRAAMPRRKHRRKKAVAKSLVPVQVIPDVSHEPPTAKAIEIAWTNGIALDAREHGNSIDFRKLVHYFSVIADRIIAV